MQPRWALILLTLVACGAPGEPSGPGTSAPTSPATPPEEEEGEEEHPPAASPAELEALLPLTPDRVLWYRADAPGWPARRVALYLRQDPRRGAWWQSIGPAAGPNGLCVWRSRYAVWVLPGGDFSGPGSFRAFTGQETWSGGAGRQLADEELVTRAGEFSCVHTAHEAIGEDQRPLVREVWLARGAGLIAYEVQRAGEPVRRLELIEVAPRGAPPSGYPRGSPDELWASVQEAVLRLDPGGIERLLGPELLRRARRPSSIEAGAGRIDPRGGPVRAPPQGGADPEALRIEALLGELVALHPTRTGAWEVREETAEAPGQLLRGRERVPCRLVLRASRDGWRWEDLIVPAE